jgi:choline dehydrogenase-like flavoprotein
MNRRDVFRVIGAAAAMPAAACGEFSEFTDRPSTASPVRSNGICVIRFRNVDKNHRHPALLRGYGFQGRGGLEFDFGAEGSGARYKQAVKRGKYALTALRIQMTHGENERTLMKDATAAAAEMLDAMAGMAIHELGSVRRGADPRKSVVVTPYNQLHDMSDVFVMHGSCFVSSGCRNPTLTMMALTVRACDHLLGRFKKREI